MGKSVLHVGQDSLSQSQYPIELMIQESGQEEKVVKIYQCCGIDKIKLRPVWA